MWYRKTLMLLEIANDDDGNDRDIYLYTKLQLSQYFAYSRRSYLIATKNESGNIISCKGIF